MCGCFLMCYLLPPGCLCCRHTPPRVAYCPAPQPRIGRMSRLHPKSKRQKNKNKTKKTSGSGQSLPQVSPIPPVDDYLSLFGSAVDHVTRADVGHPYLFDVLRSYDVTRSIIVYLLSICGGKEEGGKPEWSRGLYSDSHSNEGVFSCCCFSPLPNRQR